MKASTEQPSFVNFADARSRVAFELNNTLAKSATDTSLFSLYLAMHSALDPHTISIKSLEEPIQDTAITAPCFYRRSGLAYSKEAEASCRAQSQYRYEKNQPSAWLQECLHPLPIHYRNNKNYIDDAVVHNASLACQWRLASSPESEYSHFAEISTDATLLADIVEPAQSML